MFEILSQIAEGILYPFIFLSLYFQIFMLYNFAERKGKMDNEETIEYTFFPTVTFLVPCWNEERTIALTLQSIIDLDYPKEKVFTIVIDDGSKDNTYLAAKAFESSNVKVITKQNGGKHTALNLALTIVETEYVACLDADSTLDKNALKIAVQYFKTGEYQALASCMQLRDVESVLQRAQQVEYMLSTFWRKAYSSIDAIQVLPGPFSVFKTSIFTEIGDYKPAHNAEDFEMTLRLHEHGYKIANAHKAFVYTVAPRTLKGLYKQRVRWVRGFVENAWDYRHMFFNAKYGHFGLFTLPVAVVFILYATYAFLYTNIALLRIWSLRLDEWFTVGLPHPKFSFDPFYLTADVFLFQGIFISTILVFIVAVSRSITESKDSLWKNLPPYILIMPYFLPIVAIASLYKILMHSKSEWALQDTKK